MTITKLRCLLAGLALVLGLLAYQLLPLLAVPALVLAALALGMDLTGLTSGDDSGR